MEKQISVLSDLFLLLQVVHLKEFFSHPSDAVAVSISETMERSAARVSLQ